ncbi:MAG: hypothetical protein NTW96_01430 [Planctomycetia bacterium]|nr:hypothetical protein [Planctomycetia bacterium]
MEVWAGWLFALFLLTSAVGLMVWHIRTWRAAKEQDLPPKDRDFLWRQFRRRIQTSAMLAVLAIMIFVEPWLVANEAKVLLGAGMLLLVFWLGLLAGIDILATRHYFARLRSGYLVEQAKLEIEARRLRNLRGNGKPGPNDASLGQKKGQKKAE